MGGHTFTSAYFIVYESTKHGEELVCTYPECRQGGVKFRYCRHCGIPVASRNFRTQHMHGLTVGEGNTADDEDAECNSGDSEDGGHDGREGATTFLLLKKSLKLGPACIPCRARGAPLEHNPNTAYFVISPDIKHGDELLCSFPSCKGAGAKFRYCLYCRKPVAKGNFKNRHKHANANAKEETEKASKRSSLKGENWKDGANVAIAELPVYPNHKVAAEGQKARVSPKTHDVPSVKEAGHSVTEGDIAAHATAESHP